MNARESLGSLFCLTVAESVAKRNDYLPTRMNVLGMLLQLWQKLINCESFALFLTRTYVRSAIFSRSWRLVTVFLPGSHS